MRSKAKADSAQPDLEWETRLGYPGTLLAGVDEVGRGCIAGPVVAAAVILPSHIDFQAHPWLGEVSDSKKLTPLARERLAPLLEAWAAGFAIASASVEEIDSINIYHASLLAMRRAVEDLKTRGKLPGHLLVDGNALPKNLPCPATAVVKGDLKCLSIAAASIIAKVWRDRLMAELDHRFPLYGFSIHKGYPTPDHLRSLSEHGASEMHRKSFGPVAAVMRA